MIFLDTSAIYALANRTDLNHDRAKQLATRVIDDSERFLLHNYVIVESAALIQRRLGVSSAERFLRECKGFEIHWITKVEHMAGLDLWSEKSSRGLSLVDCISFVVMRKHGIKEVLAFDPDFQKQGFRLYQ